MLQRGREPLRASASLFTREALLAIARITLDNVTAFEEGRRGGNELF